MWNERDPRQFDIHGSVSVRRAMREFPQMAKKKLADYQAKCDFQEGIRANRSAVRRPEVHSDLCHTAVLALRPFGPLGRGPANRPVHLG
jgi:hypothetical protein